MPYVEKAFLDVLVHSNLANFMILSTLDSLLSMISSVPVPSFMVDPLRDLPDIPRPRLGRPHQALATNQELRRRQRAVTIT